MIRERLPQDLDRLIELLALPELSGVGAGTEPRAWLEDDDAEVSWVYDMAPVHVTPTKNIVGHVQICRPDQALAAVVGRPAEKLLTVARLFVEPRKHDQGIARHLLNEARKHIEGQGRTAVLDLRMNGYLDADFGTRYGFLPVATESSVLVHGG